MKKLGLASNGMENQKASLLTDRLPGRSRHKTGPVPPRGGCAVNYCKGVLAGRTTIGESLTNGAEPRLVAVRGPLKGSICALPEGDYSVGRQSTCNLNLEDHAVSRKHCLFIRSGRQCTVKDLESRNGTFVNGTPVTEHPLE